MSDESVRQALRSGQPLVVIEAPAGCGKTFQGAELVRELASESKTRTLILTHTHAACSVFASRTRGLGSHVEIRTIDSLILQVGAAYHLGLGLPKDVTDWVRTKKNGYDELAKRVAFLLTRYPMIARSIALRYPAIICDEHQDSSGEQHAIAMAIYNAGSHLKIFADPMQEIFSGKNASPYSWEALLKQAGAAEELDHPHRWTDGCPLLGKWTLEARNILKSGGKLDLRSVPPSVKVIGASNLAAKAMDYRLTATDRAPIDVFQKRQQSLLVLTHHNQTAAALRGFFNRQILLWEGYTRSALEKMISQIEKDKTASSVAAAVVTFIGSVAIGFSPSSFGDRLEAEVASGCSKRAKGKPAMIQELARRIVDEPDHKGAANMLKHLYELTTSETQFAGIHVDSYREFWDAIRLGDFVEAAEGLADLAHRRSYLRPMPPDRAISTIHKAKGLESDSVILMPCDAKTFPDKKEARCLLYVALSRAKKELMIVVSPDNPSPLVVI